MPPVVLFQRQQQRQQRSLLVWWFLCFVICSSLLEPSDALWDWLFPAPTIDDSLVNTDLYINCGSPYAITDDNGQEWSRDIYAKNGWKSNLFDFIFAPNGDAGLYDTYRYSFTLFGPLRYEIPVAPNRQYAVSLYFTQRLEDDSIRQGTTNNPFILDASINTVNMNDMVIISDWTAPRNAIQRTAMITTNDNDDSISISISSTSQGSIEFLFRLFEWSGLPRNPYLNAIEIHDVSTVSPAPTLSPAPTVVEAQGVWIETDSDANLTGRQEACFVFVAATNRAYLIGGQNGNKPVDIYNPVSQTWSQGSMPPIELNHMQCVEFDDKVYILSAWVPREGTGDNNSALIYIYDPLLDAWSTQPGLPEARQRGSSATIVDKTNRRLYLSHGKRFGHGNAQDSNASPSLNWLDCYDVDTATWTALPNAPHVRDHTGGGMVNGKVCVAGGRDSGAIDVVYKKVLPTDCYDPESNTWSEAPPIPTGRSGSAYGMSCDNQLIVAGGEGFGQAWDTVELFDGTKWSTLDSLVVARHGVGLAVNCACGAIYIASGSPVQGGGANDLKSVETFYFDGVPTDCTD